MSFIDGSAVNVALPALQQSLGATVADMQWVVESYALFLSALLLVGGSLGDLYGRRLIFAIGVGLFALASTWCGLAPSISQLITARGVQGEGAAMLVPGSLAIISASFPEEKRGRAIGARSGFSAITAAIGPLIGGWRRLICRLTCAQLENERGNLAGIKVPDALSDSMSVKVKQIIGESFVEGFRLIAYFSAGLAFLSALTAWVSIGSRLTPHNS